MSVFVDILLIAILVFEAIRHYRLGLFCSILSFGKFVAAIILAGILKHPLSLLILRLFYGGGEYNAFATALCGVITYVVIFAAVIVASGFLIKRISKIKIPIITRIDKLSGLAFGLVLGIFWASLISTALYSVISAISVAIGSQAIMNVHDASLVFKFIKNISIFKFVIG